MEDVDEEWTKETNEPGTRYKRDGSESVVFFVSQDLEGKFLNFLFTCPSPPGVAFTCTVHLVVLWLCRWWSKGGKQEQCHPLSLILSGEFCVLIIHAKRRFLVPVWRSEGNLWMCGDSEEELSSPTGHRVTGSGALEWNSLLIFGTSCIIGVHLWGMMGKWSRCLWSPSYWIIDESRGRLQEGKVTHFTPSSNK